MKITAIILSGGKSSRMGEDKGLMSLDGKPMAMHVINTVKPLVDDIMIISNQEGYDLFGYRVYSDLIKNAGPLAGIYTGLKHTKTDKNIVLSCDVPFVTKEVLVELINNCKDQDVTICENDGRTHQLIGVYNKSCADYFKQELANNQRKIKLAIQKLNFKIVNLNHFDKRIFNNINSRNDITN